MLPFYLREDYMQVMVLSASAGIMEGDVQKFDIHVNSGTSMEYLSQAYEKIHKMKEGMARRETKIVVEPDAFLKYAPLPAEKNLIIVIIIIMLQFRKRES